MNACAHCGRAIEPDPDGEPWRVHADTGLARCGIAAGPYDAQPTTDVPCDCWPCTNIGPVTPD